MILPIKDIEAMTAVMDELGLSVNCSDGSWHYIDENHRRYLSNTILDKLEKLGYHKGLSSSIEETLNSGDGVCRP